MHGRDLHLDRDGGGAGIQCTAENIGKTQDVVDLVRVVGAAGGHHRVAAYRLDVFRGDLRVGVGQGKNDRVRRHFLHHGRLEHAAGRQPKKNIGTFDDLAQGACTGFLGKDDLVLVHQLGAALIDHARQISDINILARHAELDQQAQAGQCGRAGARGHQFDLFRVFAHHLHGVEQRRADDDGGAVLVVVEDRDLHALTQTALHIKAIWRLDVFQVDTAKGGFQRGNDVDELVEVVFLVDFDVKDIDAGELLEQHALALHHRLGCQRPDVAQAQHGSAVGDHRHQVAAAGVFEGIVGVFDDLFAGRGDAG